MASLDEVHALAVENSRAIRGHNGSGGMVQSLAVVESEMKQIKTTTDRIDGKLSYITQGYKDDIDKLRAELLEEIKCEVDEVKEVGPDWKWMATAALAILSPIATALILGAL